MYFLFMAAMAGTLFLLQLLLCVKIRHLWIKLLPIIGMCLYELVCWGMYWLAQLEILEQIRSIEVGFAGFVLGFMGFFWIGGVALAWGCYGIGKLLRRSCRRSRAKRDRESGKRRASP